MIASNLWHEFLQESLPSTKHEMWKYNDLAILTKETRVDAKKVAADLYREAIKPYLLADTFTLVFINGFYMQEISDHNALAEVAVIGMDTIDFDIASDHKKYPFADMNRQLSPALFSLRIKDNVVLSKPIHLLSIAVDDAFLAHPRRFIQLGNFAKATIIEECVALTQSAYMMNTVTNLDIEAEASLNYYKLQIENDKAIHMAATFLQQKAASSVRMTNLSQGSQFARDDLKVALQERGAKCSTACFYQTRNDAQSIDHHIDIHHIASHSESEMLYKGTIDKKSKVIFNGRLHVEKNAQKIIAYQANHNLLLSDSAEVYSKPELEIYADDVKCKHGATTGQINEEALFYLRSRGISEKEAMSMLLQGFAKEIFDRIDVPQCQERFYRYFAA